MSMIHSQNKHVTKEGLKNQTSIGGGGPQVQKGDHKGGKHGTKAKTKATFYAFFRIDDCGF